MTLYAPTSVPAIKFEVGGCGKVHKASKGKRLAVTCVKCEPLIVKHMAGWGRTPEGATRTYEEEQEFLANEHAKDQMFNAAGFELGRIVTEKARQG